MRTGMENVRPLGLPRAGWRWLILATTVLLGLAAFLSLGSAQALATPTGGNWVGTYGHEGYDLAAWNGESDLAETPGASLTVTQGSRYVWAAETTDERALQGPEGSPREAATFYDPTELILKLSFKEAYTGELHLYAVDWNTEARRETISAAGHTVVLNENFHEGAWVSVPIEVAAEGSVTITVQQNAGSNAVLSGLFLGGSGAPPNPLKPSTSPKGNWVGTYGHQGYDLAAWNGESDLAETPGASLAVTQGTRYVWASETADERALEGPEGFPREAATFYDYNELRLKLSFKEAYSGQLHLYAVDWNTEARRETISVAGQTALLNENFHNGAWVSFPIKVSAEGTVTITVQRTAGSNAVLSGVILGGSGSPPSATVETTPQGNWLGHYAHEGYDLGAWNGSSDLADLPSASLTVTQGSRYLWASRTSDKRALEGPEGFLREAVTYYDSNELILHLKFKEAYTGQLHLYALDWDSEARRETISVGGETAMLSTSFHEGGWASFPIEVSAEGSVTITVQRTAGSNAVLSGIFLGGSGTPPSSAPRLLVPSYFSPEKADWETMCNNLPKESIVIVNPGNGPGSKKLSEEFAPDVKYCQEKGQIVIGYVFTQQGDPKGFVEKYGGTATQTESQVKKEIEEYFEWLGVSGIFYDQYATTENSTTKAYYKGLAELARSYAANVVDVGNPGVQAGTSWVLSYVDKVITFEDTAEKFEKYKPEEWVTKEPTQIVNLIHGAGTIKVMEESCSHAAESNASDVYVTSRTFAENPWLHLPSSEYFSAEVKNC